jgi:hypothetical protein
MTLNAPTMHPGWEYLGFEAWEYRGLAGCNARFRKSNHDLVEEQVVLLLFEDSPTQQALQDAYDRIASN